MTSTQIAPWPVGQEEVGREGAIRAANNFFESIQIDSVGEWTLIDSAE